MAMEWRKELKVWRLANVLLLGMGWMLAMSGLFVNISMTSTAVSRFAGPQLSTVPVGLHMISSAMSLCIAYFAIPRFGRRAVYIVAGLLGAVGSAVMIVGSRLEIFGLLLAGSILQGPSFGVAQSFRFTSAAFFPAPQFSQEWRTRSISITVGCAVFAAGIGPEATRVVRDDLGKDFTGGYTLLVGLYLAQALLTGLVDFRWLEQIQKGQQQQQQHSNKAPQDVQHCMARGWLDMGDAGEKEVGEQLQQQQQQQLQEQSEKGQQPGEGHALDLLHQLQKVTQQEHLHHHHYHQPPHQQRHLQDSGGVTAHVHDYQGSGVTAHVHEYQGSGVTAHVHDYQGRPPLWPPDSAQSVHQFDHQQHGQDRGHRCGGGTHVHHYQGGPPPWPPDTSHLQLSAVPSQQNSHIRLPANCQPMPAPAPVAQQDACSGGPLMAPDRVQGVLRCVVPVDADSVPQSSGMGSSSKHRQQGVTRVPDHSQVAVPKGPSFVQAMAKVDFVVPALSGATAFFTMAAVMSSTPVGMQVSGHSSDLATFTIEAHVGAMYLPALVVGDLVKLVRFVISSTMNSKYMVVRLLACMVFLVLPQQQHEHHHHHRQHQQQRQQQQQHHLQQHQWQQQQQHVVANQLQTPEEEDATSTEQPEGNNAVPHRAPITFIMVVGSAVLATSPGVLLAGTTLQHFMGGLVLLGVGWALNYITASSLVTAAFSDPEQLRTAQSVMDLSVLTLMAAGNATAGVIVRLWGWHPFLILYLAIILALFACNLMYHAHAVLFYRRTVPVARECQAAKELVSRK